MVIIIRPIIITQILTDAPIIESCWIAGKHITSDGSPDLHYIR